MRKCFVLGGFDPEMAEIESVVSANGHLVRHATLRGRPVNAEEAYSADGVDGALPRDVEVVFVECFVLGLRPGHVVDHHRPGDPGYSAPPQNYLQASSLGQVLQLLGLEATAEQRIIAAADHCPVAAYQGMCPGVDIEALRAWRVASRAARRKVSVPQMEQAIEQARSDLETAERIDFCGMQIAWIGDRQGEFTEAAARYGIPFMYTTKVRDGRTKLGIMSAPEEVIAAWMNQCGLEQVYGDPVRGYAGGYC